MRASNYVNRIISELEYNSNQNIMHSFKQGQRLGRRLASWSQRAYSIDNILKIVKDVRVNKDVNSVIFKVGVLCGYVEIMDLENSWGYDYTIQSQHLRDLGLHVPGDVHVVEGQRQNITTIE